MRACVRVCVCVCVCVCVRENACVVYFKKIKKYFMYSALSLTDTCIMDGFGELEMHVLLSLYSTAR